MLAALCAASFVVASSGTSLAPFLLEMGRDLDAELPTVANLVTVLSVTWGIVSLAAGAASDRIGRRPILLLGLGALGVSRLGLALSSSYAAAALWQLLGGVGGGSFMGAVFAAVSDRMPPAQRGRALGWVITGQSLSLVFGVPVLTFLGAFGGWRGAMLALGGAALGGAVVVRLAVPGGRVPRLAGLDASASLSQLLDARLLALLGAGAMERTCFVAMAIYLATYLLTSYGVSLQEVAAALATVALGNLAGNVAGSHLADRLAARPLVFAACSLLTGALAPPLLSWQPGAVGSVGLGTAYALANALGRPALLAALSEVPANVRGAVLGLNIAAASLGWVAAAAGGGWLIARYGFGALGLFCAAAGLVGAAAGALAWRAARRGRREGA
jgi:DHA1 family inner membrane transport protein